MKEGEREIKLGIEEIGLYCSHNNIPMMSSEHGDKSQVSINIYQLVIVTDSLTGCISQTQARGRDVKVLLFSQGQFLETAAIEAVSQQYLSSRGNTSLNLKRKSWVAQHSVLYSPLCALINDFYQKAIYSLILYLLNNIVIYTFWQNYKEKWTIHLYSRKFQYISLSNRPNSNNKKVKILNI